MVISCCGCHHILILNVSTVVQVWSSFSRKERDEGLLKSQWTEMWASKLFDCTFTCTKVQQKSANLPTLIISLLKVSVKLKVVSPAPSDNVSDSTRVTRDILETADFNLDYVWNVLRHITAAFTRLTLNVLLPVRSHLLVFYSIMHTYRKSGCFCTVQLEPTCLTVRGEQVCSWSCWEDDSRLAWSALSLWKLSKLIFC